MAHTELWNPFTWTKTFKLCNWMKLTKGILLDNRCWQRYQIGLVYAQTFQTSCANLPKKRLDSANLGFLPNLLPQPANIFARICPSYPWYFASHHRKNIIPHNSIIIIQAYMADRSPFQLRGLLTAWNIFLAVFSLMGAARFLSGSYHGRIPEHLPCCIFTKPVSSFSPY